MNRYVTGPYETYILEDTFLKFLGRLNMEEHDTPAICWSGRHGERHERTYGELYMDAVHFSGHIHSMGYMDEYIGLSMGTSYEWFVHFFGIILSGNIPVLKDPMKDTYPEMTVYDVIETDAGKIAEAFVCERKPLDTAVVVFTSGTTGEPKGAELSQKGILLNAYESNLYIDDRGHRFVPLPFFHAYALTCGALSTFASRSLLYISPGESRIGRDFRLADPYTVILVPMVLEYLKRYVEPGMRVCSMVCGGAPLSMDVINWYSDRGIAVYQGYGITECSPLVAVNGELGNIHGSVGIPLPSCDVWTDDDTSEIVVSGPSVMKGYVGEEESDLVFHTGDMGYIEDGFIFVTGRIKNLIVFNNGKKVSPEEIEKKLLGCPHVWDAAIYAEPGGIYGSIICASIYGSVEHQRDIEEYISEYSKGLPRYMKIGKAEFLESPIPRTSTGKIRR